MAEKQLPNEQARLVAAMQARWATDPAYPKPKDELASVGAFIFNYNTLEDTLVRVAWFLIDQDNERAAQVILDGQDAARVEELIKALLPLRVSKGPFLDYGLKLIDDMAELRAFRRGIVHGVARFQEFGAVPPKVERAFRPKRSAEGYKAIGDALDKAATEEGIARAVALDLVLNDYLRGLLQLYLTENPKKEEWLKNRELTASDGVYVLGTGRAPPEK